MDTSNIISDERKAMNVNGVLNFSPTPLGPQAIVGFLIYFFNLFLDSFVKTFGKFHSSTDCSLFTPSPKSFSQRLVMLTFFFF